MLKVKRLTETAKLPTRANATDAAYDVYADETCVIPAGQVIAVSTGIAIASPDVKIGELPVSTYVRVAPRSGLAVKQSLDTFAGVIDKGYRGELKVALYNASADDYQVAQGDRIAQLIVTLILTPDVKEVDELNDTSRGTGGFGSTGK